MADIQEIKDTFGLLDDWEERYRYVIELGRAMPHLAEHERTDATKVRGCASQVWLVSDVNTGPGGPALTFRGESDAHIVQGLIAILIALYSGRRAADIHGAEAGALFDELGLSSHLTPQRSNGVRSMVDRIGADAEKALAAA